MVFETKVRKHKNKGKTVSRRRLPFVSGDSIIVVTLLSPIAVTVLIVNNQTVKQQSVTGDRYIIKIIV